VEACYHFGNGFGTNCWETAWLEFTKASARDFRVEDHDVYRELLQLLPVLLDAEFIEDVKRLSMRVNTLLRGKREV
jgi:hypothetical protein